MFMKRRRWKEGCLGLLLGLGLLLVPAAPARAVDSELTRKTLAGLKGFLVVVEDVHRELGQYDQALRKAGLTKAQVQGSVEQRLRAAGLRVVSNQEWLNTPGRPILYVNVNLHETDRYAFAYNTGISVEQLVRLDLNPAVKTVASTWSLSMTGNANIGNLDIVAQSVRILLDRFLQAHGAAGR
jgi:hypothetical protein